MINSIFLYLDPGSGSYLIQMIIAAVLGALFYFKHIWWKVKAFFFKSKKKDANGETES
ncbi:MAG: hypothetical protein ACTHMC_23860 [Pseudobacter sp.]|uniref:hypothetical protein n=1 Tax=Pseudobacter sp. TaxID=2045420 RepID=UPI003F813D61